MKPKQCLLSLLVTWAVVNETSSGTLETPKLLALSLVKGPSS